MKDLAQKIVADIEADALDRSGLGNELERYDDEVRRDIRRKWRAIVRRHLKPLRDAAYSGSDKVMALALREAFLG